MSNRNIHQITEFTHLKKLVSENLTVIIGFTCPSTTKNERIMIKKFLKRKAEKFPLIQFVFMELTEEQIETTRLDIIDNDYDSYPMIYHIRDGNKVLCEVKAADIESTYESFGQVEPYYISEMEEFSKAAREKAKKIKSGSKNKKSKVQINIGLPKSSSTKSNSRDDNGSESEIEMDAGMKNQNEQEEENKKIEENGNKDKLDPEMKAAIEREKFYAIEDAFEKAQEDLYNEVKDRIILEQKAAKEDEKKKKKSKSKEDKKKRDDNRRAKPQHDQIGPSKSSSTNKGQNNRRRRR